MPQAFSISTPETFPIRIEPCPIVEAVFEVRFVGPESWETVPGLLYAQIREKYNEQQIMPGPLVSEESRRQDPALPYTPRMQFLSKDFRIQLGPRVVTLVTKPMTYPGWQAIQEELGWFIQRIKAAGFVGETERLGVRYIDFFEGDVFPNLRLHVAVNDQPLYGHETDVRTVSQGGKIFISLRINNAIVFSSPQGPKPGSMVDLDGWLGPLEVDLFENGLAQFGETHHAIKRLFFGLLKPEFLATLNPVYV